MQKKYHFISGLPRSGTTLLSAILNQNPRFQASISGPLARFARAIVEQSSAQGGYRFQCPEDKREKIIKGIFENYYDDTSKEVFFDTNRGWNLLLPLLKKLYPDSKVICCVRDIPRILDSFEQLARRQPLSLSSIYPEGAGANVYTRANYMMDQGSTLGFAYTALKQALSSDEKTMLMLVEYGQLCRKPKETLQAIYNFIGEPYFEHDFDNVESNYNEFDADVNIKGMHTTRRKLDTTSTEREMILPPDLIMQYSGFEIWR